MMVTQVGQNWNELFEELVSWQSLGKDILAAQTTQEKALELAA